MKKFEVLADVQAIVMNVVSQLDAMQNNPFAGRSYSTEQVRNMLFHTLEELEKYIGNQEDESCSKVQPINEEQIARIVNYTSERLTTEIQEHIDNFDGCDCIQLDFSGYGSEGTINASVNLDGEIDVEDVIRRSQLKEEIISEMTQELNVEL
jgi:hypothetical protein